MAKEAKTIDRWTVRNVDIGTYQRITLYARSHGMSVAHALGFLTTPGSSNGQPDLGVINTNEFQIFGDLRAAYEQLKKRYE